MQSNEPTIEQMNETIARFMGMEGSAEFIKQNYRYERRWETLMPVVEKIEKEHAHVCIRPGICAIEMKFMPKKLYAQNMGIPMNEVMPIAEHNEYDFIGNVFHAVYDFIIWLNPNKFNAE